VAQCDKVVGGSQQSIAAAGNRGDLSIIGGTVVGLQANRGDLFLAGGVIQNFQIAHIGATDDRHQHAAADHQVADAAGLVVVLAAIGAAGGVVIAVPVLAAIDVEPERRVATDRRASGAIHVTAVVVEGPATTVLI